MVGLVLLLAAMRGASSQLLRKTIAITARAIGNPYRSMFCQRYFSRLFWRDKK